MSKLNSRLPQVKLNAEVQRRYDDAKKGKFDG